ncbi:unnamed protein product (macronuclear) [Paramecium tetraurelia]|uniref:Uncharacterized protein n=1 Tax=Paramecium tetraurelia TaxID=5888 RepID=A0D2X5_PARTE|nr:uncharacterized protein GSPATT00039220001 [Paramecium tetraurelia]CAK77392.1 unnamed protein product [Paramecium tetraurelia]|eukprot:XP_001444789.1 hypothetical protein (macronuclear) [Paramecium tetraurelia strain d4-2]
MNHRSIRPSSAQQNVSHISDKNVSFHKKYYNSFTLSPYKQPNVQNVSSYKAKESEKLFEESLQLKLLMNQLKDENIKLRTRNTNLEKDLQKCQKIIEEVETTGNMKRFYAKPSTDNQMILSFKGQIKELRQNLDQREQEMLALKKTAKYTKLTEMEIERKMLQDETIRLKQVIDELIQQNLYAQQKEHDQQKLQDMISQRDNLIKQMQQDIESFESDNQNLQSQLQKLISAYQDLDKEYTKLNQTMQTKIKQKDKQVVELKTQLTRLKEQYEKEKKLLQQPKFSPTLKTHNKVTNRIQSAKPPEQITKPIQFDEVTSIIEEIKYKLIALSLHSKQIDTLLLNQSTQQTTIGQLTDKLINDPLFLNKNDANNFARFLIESPQQRYPYTPNLSIAQDNGLIRGMFFKAIGFWPCYDQVEKRVVELCLAKLFQGSLIQVEKVMGKNVYKKKDFITQIQKILQKKQIRELELTYLISKIILQSKSLNTLKGDVFVKYLRELEKLENEEDIRAEDLQQYYDSLGQDKGFFFYKQLRSKQEQMIALLETKEDKVEEIDINQLNDGIPQKSVQQYILKGGLVRSHSDPDPLQLILIQKNEEEEEEEENYEQQQQKHYQNQQQYEKKHYPYNFDEEDGEYENNEEQNDDYQLDLNNAQIEEQDQYQEEDDDYNINVDGVFEEDNDDENDQWERVENKGNFPVRQDRQIPNSRPTSSYVNKVNRSNSDVKASLASELHPTKEINEEEYMEEQFEEEN